MTDKNFKLVCSTIDANETLLDNISQSIWQHPELGYEEKHAHKLLTDALEKLGFEVTKNFILETAFRAEYSSQTGDGPTVGILLEYDALPGIGHACGHNLISEAGLAAGVAVKKVMEADPSVTGKIVLLGTPAEESGGGKIQMLKSGAFMELDAALMVHPADFTTFSPVFLSHLKVAADFSGKAAHAAGMPWEGRNALDAAVAAYQNIALLRQQLQPSSRIHAIISNGGTATNIIPSESRLELGVRATTKRDTESLLSAVRDCIEAGAKAARCEVSVVVQEDCVFESLNTNQVLKDIFQSYAMKLGIEPTDFTGKTIPTGSSDMGNVSQVLPSIHPFFKIETKSRNHSKDFTDATGSPRAQGPTLAAAKALAMTAVQVLRCPDTLKMVKSAFQETATP